MIRSLPNAIACTLFAATFTTNLGHATNPTQIPNASSVTRATVILHQLGIFPRRPLSEHDLKSNTDCTFVVNSDREKISKIVKIIRSNSVEKPDGVGRIELRNLIYLNLDDGTTVRFMFGEKPDVGSDVFGGMDGGKTGDYVPLLANVTLLNELRDWAAETVMPDTRRRSCLAKVKQS